MQRVLDAIAFLLYDCAMDRLWTFPAITTVEDDVRDGSMSHEDVCDLTGAVQEELARLRDHMVSLERYLEGLAACERDAQG